MRVPQGAKTQIWLIGNLALFFRLIKPTLRADEAKGDPAHFLKNEEPRSPPALRLQSRINQSSDVDVGRQTDVREFRTEVFRNELNVGVEVDVASHRHADANRLSVDVADDVAEGL